MRRWFGSDLPVKVDFEHVKDDLQLCRCSCPPDSKVPAYARDTVCYAAVSLIFSQ